uniref:anthranilate synthase component II n=1 Tax=Roseivirga sp. TaxID=1964215 RepID=UPI004048E593
MILIFDNYDSFTYNLVDYFGQIGISTKVIRNDSPLAEIDFDKYSGIVLSPGPERPKNAGNLMIVVENQIGKRPMLGICLGHQAIGQYLGAKLVKASYPMHGKLSEINVEEAILFKALPASFKVVRYHSLVLQDLPKSLKAVAYTKGQELMAFESQEFKVAGIQFHPEAILTEYGLEMLKNWVTFYNIV